MTERGKRRMGLADFLKTRRARLYPEQFGLPLLGRRRTPGLRREELAQLIGMGVSWYTWLEQGRDIQVSDQVLARLASILQLSEEERSHLFLLAHRPSQRPWELARERLWQLSAYQAILDAFIYPAQLIDRSLNVVAWNESASRVFGDFSHRSLRERNTVWFVFMNPSQREYFVNWEQTARQSMAILRARSDQYADETGLRELIAELQQTSPEFRAWWPEHDILLTCRDFSTINHPLVGRLAFQPTKLVEPSLPDLGLVVHTPLPQEDTSAKLKALMAARNQSSLTR
jgi:hypothetical protein